MSAASKGNRMSDTTEHVRADEQDRRANTEHQEINRLEGPNRLSARQIYEVVRRDGVEEMTRPLLSLTCSGLAAGILISVSLLAQATLRAKLPDAPWSFLIESFGYSLGFLLVIESRMQLFTENTVTTVLPLASRPRLEYFILTARLWSVVLMANVAGGFLAASFLAHAGAVPADIQQAMHEVADKAVLKPALEGFAKAVPSGVLIAAIAWMLPTSPRSPFHIVVTFTWVIAVAGFGHIVLGSVEMAYLAVNGAIDLAGILTFFIPVLLGNVVGGTLVFTLIAWAQVVHEIDH